MNYYICDELTLEEGQKKLKLNDFYSFEKTFSEEECNRIIREFDDTATPLEAGSRKAKTSKIHYNDKSDWIYNKISGMVIEANRVMWGFGIFGISAYFSGHVLVFVFFLVFLVLMVLLV